MLAADFLSASRGPEPSPNIGGPVALVLGELQCKSSHGRGETQRSEIFHPHSQKPRAYRPSKSLHWLAIAIGFPPRHNSIT